VSGLDVFNIVGAVAGIISLAWMIIGSISGSYDSRTLRLMVDSQSRTLDEAMKQLGRLEQAMARRR
jgi:hypothetical protein